MPLSLYNRCASHLGRFNCSARRALAAAGSHLKPFESLGIHSDVPAGAKSDAHVKSGRASHLNFLVSDGHDRVLLFV